MCSRTRTGPSGMSARSVATRSRPGGGFSEHLASATPRSRSRYARAQADLRPTFSWSPGSTGTQVGRFSPTASRARSRSPTRSPLRGNNSFASSAPLGRCEGRRALKLCQLQRGSAAFRAGGYRPQLSHATVEPWHVHESSRDHATYRSDLAQIAAASHSYGDTYALGGAKSRALDRQRFHGGEHESRRRRHRRRKRRGNEYRHHDRYDRHGWPAHSPLHGS